MARENPDSESGAKPDAKPSAELASNAQALSGALGSLLRKLDVADPEIKKRLEALKLVFEEHARRSRDVASGAASRRARPMAQAWTRARDEGGAENWQRAFAELAQVALGESRPAWYAASALMALRPDWDQVGVSEAKALVAPIEQEHKLQAPGYQWAWLPTDAPAVVETWARVRRSAGLV